MKNQNQIKLFEDKKVRSLWSDQDEQWYFSVVDVIAILTESLDANAYWRKLKQRLKEEGNQTVTNCHSLKMLAADGKQRATDVADTEQLLRKKSKPLKQQRAFAQREYRELILNC